MPRPRSVFVLPSDNFLIAGPDAYVAAKDAARRDLLELKAELRQTYSYSEGEDYHLLLMEGEAAQSILDCARQNKADMIVVGTHGRGGLGKILMGSVAERVFRQSPVAGDDRWPAFASSRPGFCPAKHPAGGRFHARLRNAPRTMPALWPRERNAKLTMLHVLDHAELSGVADRPRSSRELKRNWQL